MHSLPSQWGRGLYALALCCATTTAQATLPQNPTGFDFVGVAQEATLLNPADPLSGGTITINNQVIIVPSNTVFFFPACSMTWQEVFDLAPEPYRSQGQTGLALSDNPAPKYKVEFAVTGNRVGNSYIAGLISIATPEVPPASGFINHIDYDTGFFRVGGVMGDPNSGARVKLNDPNGRFGRAWSPDVRFTVDDANPSITAGTGFPMGIPRSQDDPLIPHSNRPIDPNSPSGFAQVFTMPPPSLVQPGSPDPRVMAPLEVGDFITYSGQLFDDAQGSYMAIYGLEANVGIYTAPGTNPVYVRIDGALFGLGGVTAGAIGGATARTRFEGMTTDPTRSIQIFGVDVDHCSAAPADRDWGICSVDPGPPLGGIAGRWRFRGDKLPGINNNGGGGIGGALRGPLSGSFLPATRELRVQVSGATLMETANGILAGQYQAPIGEYLFPEALGPGAALVPYPFDEMPFLAMGSGMIAANGPIVSQLVPWPGLTPPSFVQCGSNAVVAADAGADVVVASGQVVNLLGLGAGGPAGTVYSYQWSQVAGTPVQLGGANTDTLSFIAPLVLFGSAQTLTFQLTVSGAGLSGSDFVDVTVNPLSADVVTIGVVEYRRDRSRLTVTAASTAANNNPQAVLRVEVLNASGVVVGGPITMPPPAGGTYTLQWAGAPQPTTVRVTSSYGGSATSPVTRLR